MVTYTAAPDGSDRVVVINTKTGNRVYSIQVDTHCERIISVVPTGDTLSVTYERKDGDIRCNFYNLEKGIKKYSNQISQAPVARSRSGSDSRDSSSALAQGYAPSPMAASQATTDSDGEAVGGALYYIFKLIFYTLPFAPLGLINKFYNLHAPLDKIYPLSNPFGFSWVVAFLFHLPLWFGDFAFWILSKAWYVAVFIFQMIMALLESLPELFK
jgi:hypothetical protein